MDVRAGIEPARNEVAAHRVPISPAHDSDWQPHMDLNHGFESQSLAACRLADGVKIVPARSRGTGFPRSLRSQGKWLRESELNRRRLRLQRSALPAELSRSTRRITPTHSKGPGKIVAVDRRNGPPLSWGYQVFELASLTRKA
jgi:hypothetical protein